jgi:hypothetical protein
MAYWRYVLDVAILIQLGYVERYARLFDGLEHHDKAGAARMGGLGGP